MKKFAQLFTNGYTITAQGVFKLWIQREGDHSNIKSQYVQNSVIGMYRYIC